MGKFISDLDVSVIWCGKDVTFELITPFAYVSDFLKKDKKSIEFIVPAGFVAHSIGKADVLHEYLYSTKALSRWGCDRIYLEALEDSDVGFFRRHFLFYRSRLFGQSRWEIDW